MAFQQNRRCNFSHFRNMAKTGLFFAKVNCSGYENRELPWVYHLDWIYYSATLKPLITLQKRAIRIITFSKPDEHSEPLFKELEILKLTDLVTLHNALLMYHYHYNLLPSSFEKFFPTVASVHSYNTRLASKSTYYINTIKTNYGKFNIRFAAAKVWNNLDENIKHLPLKTFKNKVKSNILQSYCSWVFKLVFVYLFIYSFIYSFIYLFIYSFSSLFIVIWFPLL